MKINTVTISETFPKRLFFSILGIVILSFGSSILRVGNAGLDPFTASNLAIGVNTLHLSLGIYQLIVNLIILFLVFIFKRELIGIGTIINMVFVGFLIDFFTSLYHQFFDITLTFPLQLIYLIIGVLIFTLGTSMYMASKLGNAPYDSIAPILVDHNRFSYRTNRVSSDVAFFILSIVFGGIGYGYTGLGTIINAFFAGPFIVFWNKKISYPLIWNKTQKEVEENINT